MSILVIDVGTSGVRAAVVEPDASVRVERHREVLPDSPAPGLVEFDALEMARVARELADEVRAATVTGGGSIDAVGITNQRASTIVWDRATGEPVGPGIGWQDLRTIGECLALAERGLRFAPNQSATKLAHLLDEHDPQRSRDLCFGTVDTWLVWVLSEGRSHLTDLSNAAVTGMVASDGGGWDHAVLDALRIPAAALPEIGPSSGLLATASALDGAPPICGLAGDQQASLLGQGIVAPGPAKITFGTGGMLDLVLGEEAPATQGRGEAGTYPIVAWQRGSTVTWGLEAVMLSAGTNVEWLRDDLGLINDVASSHDVAAACESTGGVVYVPALLGLGTPRWDYGARGTLLGITRGTGRPEVVRAVLEGVAQRGTDLAEAAETDAGRAIPELRVDGGMSRNPTFVQALADASQRPVEVSPVREATTLGAAFLAGLEQGTWGSWDDIAAAWQPAERVEPGTASDWDRWHSAVERAAGWLPELSALDF